VISFGCAITKPDVYRRCAQPGLRRAAEPDSEVWEHPASGTIFESYNALLDRAAERDDVEALVIAHQDTEIVSEDFAPVIRRALADPDVALVGCVGAVGVRSIAWWEGSVTLASFSNRYDEHGGGDLPAFSWDRDEAPPYARTGEVEALDGFLLVMSPWAIRNVRFDETLGAFHGYDLDYCLQVREAGRKVVTADVRAIHHRNLLILPDPDDWAEAHVRVTEKWYGRMPGIGQGAGTWEERARLADAQREAARLVAYSRGLELDARVVELEGAVAEATSSISWRITAPLRWATRGQATRPATIRGSRARLVRPRPDAQGE
jgi:Glycosyltransferase like family